MQIAPRPFGAEQGKCFECIFMILTSFAGIGFNLPRFPLPTDRKAAFHGLFTPMIFACILELT